MTGDKSKTMLSRWPHRVGVLLTCIVFPLIWVGGLVTTFDAGMAVPDWPNTYDYNMFAYPVRDWFFGPWDLFVEHGHRLLGSLAGVVSIVLVIVTFNREPRRWVGWLSVVVLVMVIAQGVLGGMRVLLDARTLAKIHGCFGPAFFGVVVGYCVVTSRWWIQRDDEWRVTVPDSGSNRGTMMTRWAAIMLLICFGQLVIGAFLRHIDAASPPSIYASLIIAHLITAVVVVVGTVVQWAFSRGLSPVARLGIRGSANWLFLLVFLQFGLGIGTWVVKYGWPVWFENMAFAAQFVVPEKTFVQMNLITAHVAVGSLILAFWTAHLLRCQRVLLPDAKKSGRRVQSLNKSPVQSA